MNDMLRIGQAAKSLGVCEKTLRNWETAGKLIPVRVNERGDRRYSRLQIESITGRPIEEEVLVQREALYLRVSGRGDQMSSLEAQEQELRTTSQAEIVAVFSDIGSGLNEKRRGLNSALRAAERKEFEVLRITYADRLTRFGLQTLKELFASYGVEVRLLHEPEQISSEQELVDDFVSLLASFSGRLYGQGSAATRKRLIDAAGV